MRRDAAQDAIVNLAAHPLAWPIQCAARRLGGALDVPGLGLVVSDAALAREIFLRDAEFTKNGRGGFAAVVTQVLGPFALANMDGAAHRELRTRLSDVLSTGNVDALLTRACVPSLSRLYADLADGRTVDLVAFMETLSGAMTCEMMGVTPPPAVAAAVHREIVRRGARIASAMGFSPLAPRRLAEVLQDCDWLWELARPNYENAPEGTLINRLRAAGLSCDETRGILLIMFLAGTLTIASALPRIVALLVDSGEQHVLRRDPSLAPAAVDEGLRCVAPVPATTRIARSDVHVGGRVIRAGSRVIVLTGNLARDAKLFADPHRFDIARAPGAMARHLWYGAGPHFCFGFPLAQRELALILETLAALPAPLRITSRRPAWGALIPSYRSLRISADPAPREAA